MGENPMDIPDGFATTYGVELLCEKPPVISKAQLLESLEKRCPDVAPLDGKTDSDMLAFVYKDHLVHLSDGFIPAQTFIAISEQRLDVEELRTALEQSWNFPEAQSVVEKCVASVLVTDLMSAGLEYQERLELFQNVLASVIEVIPCLAIHWKQTQQIISPDAYLQAFAQSPTERFFAGGAINVRLFNISDRPGEMLMDTLGLSALGLTDLQCHFHNLNPDDVTKVLYNTAFYLYKNGDVIEDGNTIQGIAPDSRWRCRFEDALVEPQRVVIDLNPGKLFAAGNR